MSSHPLKPTSFQPRSSATTLLCFPRREGARHCEFAFGQSVYRAQFLAFGALAQLDLDLLASSFQRFEQVLAAIGFTQEIHRPGAHRRCGIRYFAEAGQEDHRVIGAESPRRNCTSNPSMSGSRRSRSTQPAGRVCATERRASPVEKVSTSWPSRRRINESEASNSGSSSTMWMCKRPPVLSWSRAYAQGGSHQAEWGEDMTRTLRGAFQ